MDSQPDLELQHALQRFVTEFTDRITQSTETLERSRHLATAVRDEALRKNLVYVSSAIEIASGAVAEISLIDMIVFVRLCRGALTRHWIPELYGDEGRELADAFARSEEQLARIAEQALSPQQRQEVAALVDSWIADNPRQYRVEGIRFADFAAAAGGAAAERALKVRGLLSSVKTATRAANEALMLTERALFLLNRMPFLWRLQVRVGAREVLSDAVTHLADGPEAPIRRLRNEARHMVRRGALYVAALGGAATIAWWVGSLVRR